VVLARWVYANKKLMQGKSVHEIGSGCGLVGLVAATVASETTLSDYKDEILQNLQQNVKLNSNGEIVVPSVRLKHLDFEKVFNGETQLTNEDKVDIVLASDVVYGLHLAKWVPAVLHCLLKIDGVFYGIMPKNRWLGCR